MSADRHLGESAELHALGALEPDEAAWAEAHVASCASCARAMRAAAATVAALDDAFVPAIDPPERLAARLTASARASLTHAPPAARRKDGWAPGLLATAAALLLAAGIGGGVLVEQSADTREAGRESAVLATIATSHFNHVTLTARAPSAPATKVLYARDGAWFYVIIAGAAGDSHIVAHSAAGWHDLGKAEGRGTTATLFVRDLRHPDGVELIDGAGRVISYARLVYPGQ